jgi:mannitol/fructose-specific phosphotransferase system IIA component (Ntr-type)
MNLARFLKEERVDLALDDHFDEEHPATVTTLAEHMSTLLETSEAVVNPTKLRNDLVNREKRAPSLMGQGIAMPHVRTLQARRLVMAVGISREGLELPTPDEEDVHLVVALVGPTYDDKTYLQVYKRLSETLTSEGTLATILAADRPGEVLRALSG